MVEKTIEITPLPSLIPEEPLFDEQYEKTKKRIDIDE
jgi:hypothetical protein